MQHGFQFTTYYAGIFMGDYTDQCLFRKQCVVKTIERLVRHQTEMTLKELSLKMRI